MNSGAVRRLALCLDRTARLRKRHIRNVQYEFASLCTFKQRDGLRHFVMSRSGIVMELVRFNEHVRHFLLQELTRVRGLHFTSGDGGQDIALNDFFELGRQRFGRKTS